MQHQIAAFVDNSITIHMKDINSSAPLIKIFASYREARDLP